MTTIAIFGVPLVVATVLLSPQGLDYILHGVAMYSVVALLFLPFVAWPVLATEGIFPTGASRKRAVLRLWLGGAVLVSAVMNFLGSALDYSPSGRGFDPAGHELIPYDPQLGLLIGGFALCLLIATGIWGVAARLMAPNSAVRGAFVTGLLLFGTMAGIGYALAPDSAAYSGNSSSVGYTQGPVRPPHVEDAGDSWQPEDGYAWVSHDERDLRVRWQPGKPSRRYPHVIASDHEGKWKAERGYTWLDPDNQEDFRVRPVSTQ